MTTKIESFSGEYAFLSNFWDVRVEYDGGWFSSVEHAYQAAKYPKEARSVFRNGITPGQAKRLGGAAELPWDWEHKKIEIMTRLVLQKFRNNNPLKFLLLSTGDATLIEGNHWGDRFWGQCGGTGKNHLGRILMYVRTVLRNEETLSYFFTEESPVED